ncbi:MAG: hypothetical protein JNL44_13375 [Gemmatimonadetes bacterium]|nr:hypothetical protein [Gemmatimonadota bacterium]
MQADFIEHIQAFTARNSVTASATRSQGAPGIAEAAREHLRLVPLQAFAVRSRAVSGGALDAQTKLLEAALPRAGRSWGLSRKLLNIFLRNALYTVYLRNAFHLAHAERWYEVPLDGVVAERVAREPEGRTLPAWPGVKHLERTESEELQEAFRKLARRLGVAPVHLDALYWGGDRNRAG